MTELPAGFDFGVATAGFQTEGGFNGPGEPRNNWSEWEQGGRVEPSGIALDFWNDYEAQLDRVAWLGCTSFRMSVEWARCEPQPGQLDTRALEHYARILDACRARGLEPVVTLHHFTHPAWLGRDLWLDLDAPARFARWAATAVEALGDRCRRWITINEINVLALLSYLAGSFPPGRVAATGHVLRSLDALLTGHVLAADAIRALQPEVEIATNTYAMSLYELDRMLVDVLLLRHHGVDRDDVGDHLAARRERWYAGLPRPGRFESVLRRASASALPLDQALPRAIGAVYDSAHTSSLDAVQVDFYVADTAAQLVVPGGRTAGGRNRAPVRPLWDDRPDPQGLVRYCRAAAEPGLPLQVIENGLCNRVVRGRSYPRGDGWDRPRYLRENLAAVIDLLDGGVPVTGYWHWTLADNYEWGSYEPRFGLYGVDRERGGRWSPLDSMGHDAAGAYRRIIAGLRAGDRHVLEVAA